MSEPSVKKSRKSITLETKIKIIQLFDESVEINEICKHLQLARSTVYTVLKDKQKYLAELKNATPVSTTKIRRKDSLIADMEKVLNVWIDEETKKNVVLTQSVIQRKAQCLFNEMKARRGNKEDSFGASKGWFQRFKKRTNLFGSKPESAFPHEIKHYLSKLNERNDSESLPREAVYIKEDPLKADEEQHQEAFESFPQEVVDIKETPWKGDEEKFPRKVKDSNKDVEDKPKTIRTSKSRLRKPDMNRVKEETTCDNSVSNNKGLGLSEEILLEGLRYFETGLAFFKRHDPNSERSLKLKLETVQSCQCYYELLQRKQIGSGGQTVDVLRIPTREDWINREVGSWSRQCESEIAMFVKSISSQVQMLPKSVCNLLFKQILRLIEARNGNCVVNPSWKCDEGEGVFIKSEMDIQEATVGMKGENLDWNL